MRNFKIIVTYRCTSVPPEKDYHATVMVLERATGYPTLDDALAFLRSMENMKDIVILSFNMVNLEDSAFYAPQKDPEN